MSAKHTAGPWRIVPYGDGDSLVIHDAREGEWRVCFLATPAKDGDFEWIKANARLIAAAPDLLDATKIGLAAIERELRGLLESECLLDKQTLEPRRETIDPEFESEAKRLEEAIATVEAAIAKAVSE